MTDSDSDWAELAGDFCRESLSLLDSLEAVLLRLEALPVAERGAASHAARRTLHTLKGNAALIGAGPLEKALHRLEDEAGALGSGGALGTMLASVDALREHVRGIEGGREPGTSSAALERISTPLAVPDAAAFDAGATLRLDSNRLDELARAAGHLTEQNNQLQRLLAQSEPDRDAVKRQADALDAAVRSVHALSLQARAVPLGPVLARYARLVRDEAARAGKSVALKVRGEATELDRALLDTVNEALVHLVRNAVVHGIEPCAVRSASKKPEQGTVTLQAIALGSRVEISVEDDGAGLDRAGIASRAAALRLPALPAEQLIFEPGLSTAKLSSSAGRGIGLDVVKRNIERMGGSLDVESRPGAGTAIRMRVPASIAIERALLFELGGETWALPISNVAEAGRVSADRLRWLGRGPALEHRGRLVPLLEASRIGISADGGAYAIIVRARGLAAVRVQALRGQDDFVFHPLAQDVRGDAPISSAALLGDGRVVLRFDPEALVARAQQVEARA